METPTQKLHQIIDKIHLGYLGILPAIATFAAFTIHRPPPFLMLLGGTVMVSVYLAVVFSYWRPSPSPAVGLLALLDGPVIAAFAQFGQGDLAAWAMNSFAIDGVAIWLAILWLAGTTLLPSPGQRIATFFFGVAALGTTVWLFLPHLWGNSVSGITIVGLLIGVAEAVVVRTRLLKQDEVTRAADKNTIGIVVFLGLWVAALIAGSVISDA